MLKQRLRHLPFVLVVFMILLLGLTDAAMGFRMNVFVTLLAPVVWLGWYALSSDRAAGEE